jgi:signal transduction histidine kinase
MSGSQQIQALTWILYVVVFALVLVRTIRRPTPAHINMSLFFGAVSLLIALTVAFNLFVPGRPWWFAPIVGGVLMALPYLLLRLVGDFADVPIALYRVAEAAMLLSVVALALMPTPAPTLPLLLLIVYFVLLMAFAAFAFLRAARHSRGVTRRRMQAAAAGSACLGLVLLFAAMNTTWPDLAWIFSQAGSAAALGSSICYFIGFAPPTWLRRAWQEPELRAFLGRAASLPRLPDTASIVAEVERGAAESVGATRATIGLWDAPSGRLRFAYVPPPDEDARPTTEAPDTASIALRDGVWEIDPSAHPVQGRALLEQRAYLVTDVRRADPSLASLYEAYHARSALAAPITAGAKRLGVLVVYAQRAPVFANSDLELVRLLADQAAVLLESRALIDEATYVRAREEATRLKDDFLSSAAHDLKTPLTGLVAQAQLLNRRAQRDPNAPVDRVGLNRMLEQSLRLRDLVLELLDVSRLEHGGLVGERSNVDLRSIVQEAVGNTTDHQRVRIDAPQSVPTHVDAPRLGQVVTNLVENALKYSPSDTRVDVRVWAESTEARLCVEDQGIGIPADDLPHVFERFHRARNVDDRRFAGMGLGLYIARGIVEQHGGRIWVESVPGRGSAFHVGLPLEVGQDVASDTLAVQRVSGG